MIKPGQAYTSLNEEIKMKIMTFNTQHCLNYLKKAVDYEIMAKAILDLGADIVGLNEMFDEGKNAKFGAQTKKLSTLTGLNNHYFAQAILDNEGPYGNGLLSRYKILESKTIMIPDPSPKRYNGYYETRCILKARLENGITVLITHFGLNPDEVENAVNTVLEHLEDEKCILMGDFNVLPSDKMLLPIRERMIDASSLFEEELLSFPSDKPTIKIDYIFVSKDIEVISADIPPIVASDHRPHVAEIRLD